MKRAVVYARVSTTEQAEKGYSLPSQIEACREYAIKNDLEVIKEIQDDCSGTLLDRPGLDELRSMFYSGEISAVIVLSSDRWTRKLAHKILLRDELKKYDTELHFVNRGKSEDTPESKLMENIEGTFDEYWREKIIEATRRGRNRKVNSGLQILSGFPPLGYKKIGKGRDAKLIIDEHQSQLVKDIFWLYINGKGEGPLSLRAIACYLESCGIAPPGCGKRAANHWIPSTVSVILKNEIYIGRTFWGKSRIIDKKRIKQPKEKWVAIEVPDLAFIPPDWFFAAQERIKRNKELARRNQKLDYLLSGHFRCGYCGSAMTGMAFTQHGKKIPRYRCGKHWGKFKNDVCQNINRPVTTNKIDTIVWNWLHDLLIDDSALDDGIRKMEEHEAQFLEPKVKRLENIQASVEQRKLKIERLIDQLGDSDSEDVRAVLKEKVKTISNEIDALRKEAKSLEVEMRKQLITAETKAEIFEIAQELREELDNPDYESKRFLLDKLNVEAVYRYEDGQKWIDVRCGLVPDWRSVVIESNPSAWNG